jgi:hypothetical protein
MMVQFQISDSLSLQRMQIHVAFMQFLNHFLNKQKFGKDQRK